MEFTFKTTQMIKVSERVGTFYDLEKGAYDGNLKVLADLVSIFGNVSFDDACAEIDKQLDEGKKVVDLYTHIFEEINKKGFFKENLQASLTELPVDLSKLTANVIEEMYQKVLMDQANEATKV